MSKAISERTHGKRIKATHETRRETAESIRAAKCQRSKQRRQNRLEEIYEAIASRPKRTPQEQLKELDRRLGKGKGAKRERAKLMAKMEHMKVA